MAGGAESKFPDLAVIDVVRYGGRRKPCAAGGGNSGAARIQRSRLKTLCSTKPQSTPSMEEKIQRLKRMLLRLATFVEEAEGRRITNHSMLHQVNMLRQDMHRGFKKAYEEEMNEYDDDKACVDDLGVLPITGPAKVGKSTLVEHVCYDERAQTQLIIISFKWSKIVGHY
ncbi:hypothetical protein E2562_027750 [Oryza meyeriana var. granulata]|uniref:Uncharacterized protein n=1 Tax=Oryza meyeriana var. granulata TaxID=110450 RepID=A0A6G1EQI5_9ORYZ|nr:hypothetical protein E2562_027750 [Oryza meyeriana var. granulata]